MLLYRIKIKIYSICNKIALSIIYFLFFKFNLNSKKKRLLIIKNDAIGDYIIVRNFIQVLKENKKFNNYEIYILTNAKVINIINDLDKNLFTKTIEVPMDFVSTKNKISFYFKLKKYKFNYAFHPTFSPDVKTHTLVKYSGAKYKIGYIGDTSNIDSINKLHFEKYYTQLIQISKNANHEFEKQKEFFECILNEKIIFLKPFITNIKHVSKKQIVICPGANAPFRIWSTLKQKQLINLLHSAYPYLNFIIISGPNEEHLYNEITAELDIELTHKNKLNFINYCKILKESELVICMDSAPAHLSVAIDVNSVCISNGNHYKRFVPYPQSCQVKQKVILPPQLITYIDKNISTNLYYNGSDLDINTIQVETVFNACKTFLQ